MKQKSNPTIFEEPTIEEKIDHLVRVIFEHDIVLIKICDEVERLSGKLPLELENFVARARKIHQMSLKMEEMEKVHGEQIEKHNDSDGVKHVG